LTGFAGQYLRRSRSTLTTEAARILSLGPFGELGPCYHRECVALRRALVLERSGEGTNPTMETTSA
jgi:hypothetical protein